jgi:tRNA pseudouridine38-40 synthase
LTGLDDVPPPVRLRLDLAYDGTEFSGWATQPGRRTVEGVLSAAISVLARGPVRLTVAGRTDAGVHARHQVAHVDVPDPEQVTVRGLNGLLPPDVRVHAAVRAPSGFDARFSALARVYRYRVSDRSPQPLRRRETLSWPRPLVLARMQQAAVGLLGLHDFAAFCRAREGRTAIRTLRRLDWARAEDGVLTATVEADAFCHSMVRSLVGALLAVGDGRWDPDRPAAMLGATRRSDAVVVAPAHGLSLLEVRYPPDAELAQRASTTRAVRRLP